MGTFFVWLCFVVAILFAISRPWLGIVAYYFFVFLQPKWNWHYAIPYDFPFERYIVIAIVVGALFQGVRPPRVHFIVQLSLFGLVLWLLVGLIGANLSRNTFVSWALFDQIWKISVVAYFVSVSFCNPDRIRVLLRMSMIAALYSGYRITDEYRQIGFCRYVQDGWGFGVGSNQASMTFMGLIMISLSMMLYEKKYIWKGIAFASFALQSHALMLFESRSCMLGAISGAAVILFFAPKTRANITVLLVSLVAASILAGPSVIDEFNSTFQSDDKMDLSALSRYDTWSAGMSVFRENPVFGLGPDMSSSEIPKYMPPEYRLQYGKSLKNPHNTPIEILCDFGALGFAGYYLFVFSVLSTCVALLLKAKKYEEEPVSLLASASGLIGILVASFFSSSLMVEVFYMLVGVGAGGINWIGFYRAPSLVDFDETLEFRDDESMRDYFREKIVVQN